MSNPSQTSDYDLKDLAGADIFERLCRDLLLAEGCKNVRGLGSGPDQGSDIMVDVENNSPIGTGLVPYIVQCKWYTTPIGQDVIKETVDYLSLHRATGLLIMTSSHFSGTAVSKANAISRDTSHPYQVHLWDSAEIYRRLQRHPALIAKYWYRTSEGTYQGKPDVDVFPKYSSSLIRKELATAPAYESANAEWYLRPDYSDSLRRQIQEYITLFANRPPTVTIIRGSVGAGKTCLAQVLLNKLPPRGGMLQHYLFNQYYEAYASYGDGRLPYLLAGLSDIDFLAFDDYGYGLGRVAGSLRAVEVLNEIVRLRIREGRVTIIVEADGEDNSQVALDYIALLARQYPVIDLGTKDWRGVSPERQDLNGTGGSEEVRYSGFLGRGWISEKLGIVERQIERAHSMLAMTDEDVAAENKMRSGRGLAPLTRHDLIRESLISAKQSVSKYRTFIYQLPWDSIRFDNVPLDDRTVIGKRFYVSGDEFKAETDE